MSSPTARTLAYLRQLGYLAAVTERFIAQARKKIDLFGIADILAVHPRERSVLLVQCTTAAHVGDRLRRIQARPELPGLLMAGVSVEVWGWKLISGRWRVQRTALDVEGLGPVIVQQLPK